MAIGGTSESIILLRCASRGTWFRSRREANDWARRSIVGYPGAGRNREPDLGRKHDRGHVQACVPDPHRAPSGIDSLRILPASGMPAMSRLPAGIRRKAYAMYPHDLPRTPRSPRRGVPGPVPVTRGPRARLGSWQRRFPHGRDIKPIWVEHQSSVPTCGTAHLRREPRSQSPVIQQFLMDSAVFSDNSHERCPAGKFGPGIFRRAVPGEP